ncbi:glutamate-rich protein 6-like [Pseudochaenichthys georgianus]|uniref:glutamate-rich protein 6-like n=1 Tax=Pseudochaenichthys georgianus TaxID=52239 RepID=UPI00146A27F1|nr:glutamate-rich protein 6-like [Pseudochaenichthys georgianus]
MSQSPTYQRDSASASPESPKEGDFSPRQLYDNLKSLEEQETCDNQRDPIVNIITDNDSSSLLNAEICAPLVANDLGKLCAGTLPQEQLKKSHWRDPRRFSTSPIKENPPGSPEFMEVLSLDGRLITLVGAQTQTDWEWVEQNLFFSCQVQKETENSPLLQAEVVNMDAVADSSEEPGDEEMAEIEHNIPSVGPPRLIAHKPEPKQTPHVGEVPQVESKQGGLLAQCDYCQQLCQPVIHGEMLENETHFKRLFCCKQAKQMRELIMGERERLAQRESARKIDVKPHDPVMSEEEREAAKKQAKERLKLLRLWRKAGNLIVDVDNNSEPSIKPPIKVKNKTTDLFSVKEQTDGEPKLKELIRKFYKSGKGFLTLCPDGTGNVFYPSGKAAIIISSSEGADFTYIILEDNDVSPSIKGIFTNKGHATCYHRTGMMWLNLTPGGGLCFSETGALRRRWNWLYGDPHVRNLPFKPLTFALAPHISVRIHSQERVSITFAHKQNRVHFNVGSKLISPESHGKLGQDVLERYIQMKSSEMHSMLGQMQTFMSHHSARLRNIKPHYSFIAQVQRLSRQMEKEESPEETKAHVN